MGEILRVNKLVHEVDGVVLACHGVRNGAVVPVVHELGMGPFGQDIAIHDSEVAVGASIDVHHVQILGDFSGAGPGNTDDEDVQEDETGVGVGTVPGQYKTMEDTRGVLGGMGNPEEGDVVGLKVFLEQLGGEPGRT